MVTQIPFWAISWLSWPDPIRVRSSIFQEPSFAIFILLPVRGRSFTRWRRYYGDINFPGYFIRITVIWCFGCVGWFSGPGLTLFTGFIFPVLFPGGWFGDMVYWRGCCILSPTLAQPDMLRRREKAEPNTIYPWEREENLATTRKNHSHSSDRSVQLCWGRTTNRITTCSVSDKCSASSFGLNWKIFP